MDTVKVRAGRGDAKSRPAVFRATLVEKGAPSAQPLKLVDGNGTFSPRDGGGARADTREGVERIWRRYLCSRCTELRNELVGFYRYLVDREARRIASRLPKRVDLQDLNTAGVVGLIDAIQNYDITRQVAFEAYCRSRIRGAILDELRRADWMPRTWRLRHSRKEAVAGRLRVELGHEPDEDEIAQAMGLEPAEYRALYGGLWRAIELPGNGPSRGPGEPRDLVSDHFERLPDPRSEEPEIQLQLRELIEQIMSELGSQDSEILRLRYYHGLTLARIGKRMGISESRVCRIHTSVLGRLKRKLQSRTAEIMG